MFSTIPKKGSLQLSVNAIVVLVLAITMLGLGIAFTKGKFSELGQKIEIPAPDYPATADEPIVIPSNEVTISSTKDTILSVNIYNDGDISGENQPTMSCKCPSGAINDPANSLGQEIPSGRYKTFKITVNADSFNNPLDSGAKCLCTIKFTDGIPVHYAQKQITFFVRG